MRLKSIFIFTLLFTAFGSMAQSMDERTELPVTCLTTPTSLSADSGFDFKVTFECQIWNYGISITNSEGEAVFQSKDPAAVFSTADLPAGTYSFMVIGTTGNTVEYTHVKREGTFTVVK